jgi:hypothetical protein
VFGSDKEDGGIDGALAPAAAGSIFGYVVSRSCGWIFYLWLRWETIATVRSRGNCTIWFGDSEPVVLGLGTCHFAGVLHVPSLSKGQPFISHGPFIGVM